MHRGSFIVKAMIRHSPPQISNFKSPISTPWPYLDIPLMDYQEALEMQRALVEARVSGAMEHDLVLFLEHPPVFTLGRRGGREHLLVDDSTLAAKGIGVFHVERGGYITYHGPGQLVVYPIVDLWKIGLSVVGFVDALEEVMIRTAGDWGVEARRSPLNRGIWVGNRKLGSVGLSIRHGVSFHGLALNVNTKMEPFSWINPCGLKGVEMLSMEQVSGKRITTGEVRRAARRHMSEIFSVELEPLRTSRLPETVARHVPGSPAAGDSP
ncbi:MAG TPA: lipoyl(octanoyl) transferase LipB [Deltaproteobacteria bacterium]|nr:lipoyl(octanoyl) transferase LipB [Deltaproteobacteria bacterium]